jgi:hypothetical protein
MSLTSECCLAGPHSNDCKPGFATMSGGSFSGMFDWCCEPRKCLTPVWEVMESWVGPLGSKAFLSIATPTT